MTDLERIIEKINYIRSQGFITQEEAQELRKLARKRATQKGALGAKDREILNSAIDSALNKKGKEAKQETGLKPPSSPPPENKPTPQPPPGSKPSPQPPPADTQPPGGQKWRDFIRGYGKLTTKQDRDVIRNVFGGNPENNFAFWSTLNPGKKDLLVNVVKDGKIDAREKKIIEDTFKSSRPPGTSPTDPPPGGGGDTGDGDDSDGDYDDDDDSSGRVPNERAPRGNETEKDTPTGRSGRGKIDVPKPANRANYNLPEKAGRINMPNIDKRIKKEIDKLSLQIVALARDFIESGVDFYGIDFIPDVEVVDENGNQYFPLPDYNTPPTESGLAKERMDEISDLIQGVLDFGIRGSNNFNYSEYLNLFELRYNAAGVPSYRFSIELTGAIIEDLDVILVEDENES